MRLHLFALVLAVILAFYQPFASAGENNSAAYAALKKRFNPEFVRAGALGEWSRSAYRLAFANEVAHTPNEYIGNILRALDLQDRVVEEINARAPSQAVPDVNPGNDLKTAIGLGIVKQRILADCRHCESKTDWREHRRAVEVFFKFYDVRGGGAVSPRTKRKFSGLPFFELVRRKFADPVFRDQAIRLNQKLEQIVTRLSRDPHETPNTNIFALALEVTNGNRAEALELAGIALSRDANVVRYFEYLPPTDPAFVHASARIPLLVRLIAELDRAVSGSGADRFSFDGRYSTPNVKNYYFWSAALVSRNLRDLGISEKEIQELNAQFPRQYKFLRWYENRLSKLASIMSRKGVELIDGEEFQRDAEQVMRMSAEGARRFNAENCVGSSLIGELLH